MDFDYTPEENAFREEGRSINENLPPKKQRDKNFLNTWLEKVRAKGWVGFSGPKSWRQRRRLNRTDYPPGGMALAKAPPLGTSMMGLAWVGPGIMEYGTEEQNASSFPISWTAKSLLYRLF